MFGLHFSRLGSVNILGLVPRALAILRSYGADAHVYLPGVGTVSGITAGNYLDSAGTTAASVDNPVGKVTDGFGGIHATQGTTANKPILRRGLLNLLTYSQDLGNAAWGKTQSTITSGIADPLGGTNARRIVEQSGAITNTFINNFASKSAASLPYTSASIVNAAGRNFAWVQVSDGAGNGCRAFVSLVDGSITSAAVAFGAGFSAPVASVLQIYPGWWLIAVSGTTNTATAVYNHTGISNDGTTFAYTGNGTSGINTYGLGLFQGTLTAQQILDAGGIPLTTTAAASNANAGRYYWQFDGSNDSLSLSAPLFQMSDDHAVIAGFKRSTSASEKYVFTVGAAATNTPLCGMIACATDGIVKGYWRGDDAVIRIASSGISYVGSVPKVAAVRKVGNSKICRVNGVSGTPETSAIGATTLDATYIGSNSPAAASTFDDSIYPIIAIKGTVTDSDLLTLERFVGQLSGVAI